MSAKDAVMYSLPSTQGDASIAYVSNNTAYIFDSTDQHPLILLRTTTDFFSFSFSGTHRDARTAQAA